MAGTALVVAAATLPGALSTPAHPDDAATVTIVGTSDVSDSGLIQFLTPLFNAEHPDLTLKYVSLGTGAAITQAESGTASALIVHAASLENQFVGSGFSDEPFGRAIFWGDYVLAGPASDPAGVLNGSTHDIVGAFQKIAAAGAAGHANFVSRGNTAGTPVQEHAIWALTSGVQTCNVSVANGGGVAPSTVTGDCPTPQSPPDWYHITNATQAPNVENADVCNYPTAGNGANNNCYVFTDRGTFQFLENTSAISKLQIVTRDNNVPAHPGQEHAAGQLVPRLRREPGRAGVRGQSRHPDQRGRCQDVPRLAHLSRGPGRRRVVPQSGRRPGVPPRCRTQRHEQRASRVGGRWPDGDPQGIRGQRRARHPVAEAGGGTARRHPGQYDVPGGQDASPGPAAGSTLSFTPRRTATYSIRTPRIAKIEISTLHPVFGDLLQLHRSSPLGNDEGHRRGDDDQGEGRLAEGHDLRGARAEGYGEGRQGHRVLGLAPS